MAVFFTVAFVFAAYVSPDVAFGPLAPYHPILALALIALLVSIPNIMNSGIFKLPQTWACIVFCAAVPVSIAAGGWFSGAAAGFYGFLPSATAYLLAAANFRKRQHFQWMVLMMVLGSAYFMYNGLHDLYYNIIPSNFLYGDGELRRLRGLGFVFDPNDLGQVMVSLIPLVFLWRSKKWFLNLFLLGIPVATLVTGMYFTHSRGAAVALMATIVVALRRKIGTVPALVLAGGLFAASLAVGWSGGRDVSMEAGADRLDAWSTGLQFIKSHPVFGVGAGQFASFNEITAHNSVIVCAAEIGLPGFICWVFFIFSCFRSAGGVSTSTSSAEDEPVEADLVPGRRGVPSSPSSRFIPAAQAAQYGTRMAMAGPPLSSAMLYPSGGGRYRSMEQPVAADPEQQEDVRRMARLLITCLTGFLVAGWFLSRALSTWLFLYCGMTQAVVLMAARAGLRTKADPVSFLLRWSVIIAVGLLVLVYATLKVRSHTGH